MSHIKSQLKRSSIALAVMATLVSTSALAEDVLIYNVIPVHASTGPTLAGRLTAAGLSSTVVAWQGGSIAPLPGLSGFKQVWDLNATGALTADEKSSYLSYLQGGGAMFMMGEVPGYGGARNASLLSFFQTAGGGNLTITASAAQDQQTVTDAFKIPGGATTITYPTPGGFTSLGTSTCLTVDRNNACAAIAFKVGSLANATKGSIVSVLDVNFLESQRIGTYQGFIDGLISFVTIQSNGGDGSSGGNSSSGFVPNSNNASVGAAAVLDKLTNATTIDVYMASAIGRLSALSGAKQAQALQRIAPQTGQVQTVAATQVVSGALDTIQTRLGGIRSTSGFSVGMVDDLQDGKMMLASNGDTVGLFTEATKKYGVWTKVFGSRASQDMQSSYAGYTANSWGLAYGMDTLLRSGWVVGGAFTYADTNINMSDFRSGDSSKIRTYQLSAYASRDFDNWYLESMLAYAKQKNSGSRDTAVSGIAYSSYDGQQVAARVTAGYPITLNDKWTVTPTAGLEYTYLSQDAYQETGAGPLSLSINGQSANRVRSVIGSKLATQLETADGVTITPSANIGWRHEFNNSGMDSTATFTGGGAAFKTPGQSLTRDTMNLGAAVSFQKSKNFVLSLQLDGEKSAGYYSVAGQVTGQWRF